ncbi:MAG: FAD-binding oxidoreductase [Acidimicrobiales bacterium]
MTWSPTPAVALPVGRTTARLDSAAVEVGDRLLEDLRCACSTVEVDETSRAEAGRDWWPLAVHWALRGQVPALPAVVARPSDTEQVAAVLALCNEARVPVTPMGGRSGVCGGSVPVFGGVALDLCGLDGIVGVNTTDLLVDVATGTNGSDLEESLRVGHGLTVGHWPQSMALSTVGGWVACRSAGQYSTRYGKVEDMVEGLEVVLADGRVIETGGRAPRSATGPDLTRCLLGSEGTLGVVTRAVLRAHPTPPSELRAAYRFASFDDGLEACRLTLRRGATPAVLRLYDEAEAARSLASAEAVTLVALDEGDASIATATMDVLSQECLAAGGEAADEGLVAHWLATRNEVPSLGELCATGLVVDTVEVAARWSALAGLYHSGLAALRSVDGTVLASAHQSHTYPDGACLYFTFAGQPSEPEAYYTAAWDALMRATLAAGATISHHHGIGLNRGRWLPDELGEGFAVLGALKGALDPRGILNPGKLGLPSPWGPPPWP